MRHRELHHRRGSRDVGRRWLGRAHRVVDVPLPQQLRGDPVGLAIASDAVIVFRDGDTLTVLPELSAPPTSPGAARAPSENATP